MSLSLIKNQIIVKSNQKPAMLQPQVFY